LNLESDPDIAGFFGDALGPNNNGVER
jgi:hypothetical protein